MRVMVLVPGHGEFTYEAPPDTQVGDQGTVELWIRAAGARLPFTGTVTSLTTDYDGPCRPFVRTKRAAEGEPLE